MTEAHVNLEDALLDHLVIPESAFKLWRERIQSDVVADEGVREALEFVIDFINTYDDIPTREIISAETGYVEFAEPEIPIEYLIDKLRARYQRRELKRIVTSMARKNQEPQEALRYGFDELAKLRFDTNTRGLELTTHDTIIERYEQYTERGTGASFGFPEIDDELGGMYLGELYVGVGRPKRGKTWLYHVKSALENLHQGRSSLLFSLEMSEKEIHDRILCMEAGVSWSRFKKLELLDKEIMALEQAEERLQANEKQIFIKHPGFGDRTAQALVQEAKLYPVEIVYIDQLSIIEATNPKLPQYQQVKEICVELKDATQYWPIMLTAQYNREAEGADDIPDLTKIGLSDSVGQIADMTLGLWANADMRANNIVKMGVVESRAFGGNPKWEIKMDLSTRSNFRVLNRV